jgi:CDP-diacylglycerol--serine O-phosphatidyltransferase
VDLRKSKYILPNLFTLSSVFFGLFAIVSVFDGTDVGIRRAAIAILVAMIADGLDGRVARMTRAETKFGVQLDSLADVVSFGVAPAILGYAFALRLLDADGGFAGLVIAFVYASCGALRLARFNVMSERHRKPTPWFTGLPIPAGAGIVATLAWGLVDLGIAPEARVAPMVGTMVAMGLLMVSNVRYRSFKHVRMGLFARMAVLVLFAGLIIAMLKTRASYTLLAFGAAYVFLGPAEWVVTVVMRRRGSAVRPEDEE